MKPQSVLRTFLIGLTLLLAASGVLAQSGGSYDVEWSVVGSAGDQFAVGGSYQVGFTLGQAQESPVSAGGSYQVAQGYWSAFGSAPTAVKLKTFETAPREGQLVVLWETVSEVDTVGFHLYRGESVHGPFNRLNEALIPAQAAGSPSGARYEWVDGSAQVGQVYYYLLEDVDLQGLATEYGPVPGSLPYVRIHLPVIIK